MIIIALGESLVAIGLGAEHGVDAGVTLVALALKKTLGDVGGPLKLVPAAALCGGVAVYLLAHIAFRLRNVRSLSRSRLITAVVMLALIPLAHTIAAVGALAVVAAVLVVLLTFETVRYAEARARVRHSLRDAPAAPH